MDKKTVISLSFPAALLRQIDKLARANYTTRSDYIRQTMLAVTKRQGASDDAAAEWGSLLSVAEDIGRAAATSGYRTDEDFRRLAREIRAERTTKTSEL